MTRWLMVLASVAATATLMPTTNAEACSPTQPGWSGSIPRDGDTGVPTNAQLRLTWVGGGDAGGAESMLVDDVGDEVPSTWTTIARGPNSYDLVLQPDTPLRANASYALRGCVDCANGWLDVATFVTGDGSDLIAPTFAGATKLTSRYSSTEEDSQCGPYGAWLLSFIHGTATDNTQLIDTILYRRDGNDLVPVALGSSHYVLMEWGTGRGPLPLSGGSIGAGEYVLRAIDIAGNVDDNNLVITVPSFAVPTDDVEEPHVENGGCAIGGDVSHRDSLLVCMALAFALTRRRAWLRHRLPRL